MRCFPQLAFLIFCSLQFLAGLSIMTIFANSVMLSKSTLLALCTFQALTLTLTSRLCLNFESCLCFRGFFFFFSVVEWTAPRFQALGMTPVICISGFGHLNLRGLAFAIQGWCTFQLVVSVTLFVIFLSLRNKLSVLEDPGMKDAWSQGMWILFCSWSTPEHVLY